MNINLAVPLAAGAFSFIAGSALLNSTLALRAGIEEFASVHIGLFTALYFAGYLLGVRFAPGVIVRVGHIRLYAACASVLTVAILLHGMFIGAWEWAVLRFVSGLCVLGQYLVFESWLNSSITREKRGTVFGAYMTLTLLALGAGQLALLLGDVRTLEMFVIVSMLVAASIVPFTLTRAPEPERRERRKVSLAIFFHKAPLGLAGAFFAGAAASSFWGMGPLYFSGAGYAVEKVSYIMFSIVCGAALLQWLIGKLSDHFDRRIFIAAAGSLASFTSALLIFAVEKGVAWSCAVGFLYGAASFSIYGLCVAHINDYVPEDEQMAAVEVALTMFGWGACLGPLLAGGIMEAAGIQSFPLALSAYTGAIGAYAVYRITRRVPAPEEERSVFYPMLRTSPAAVDIDPRLNDDTQN